MTLAAAELPAEARANASLTSDYLALARSLSPLVEEHAAESERLGTMAPAVVEAFRNANLWDIFLPREAGGQGANLLTFLLVIEEVSRADSSTGWSYFANMLSATYFAAAMSDEAIADVFGGTGPARTVTAASLNQPGNVRPVEGGYIVGVEKTSFASGSGHADWLAAGGICTMDDGSVDAVQYLVPRHKVEFLGEWDVFGLAGTGSFSFRVPEQFIPEGYTWRASQWKPLRGQRDLHVGLNYMAVMGHTANSLGMAKRALEELVKAVDSSKPRPGGVPPHRDSHVFQHAFSEIDAKYRAIRAYAIECIRDATDTVYAGGELNEEQRQRANQVNTVAARIAEEVASFCFIWSGSAGLRGNSHLGRTVRDTMAANVHAIVDPHTLIISGPILMNSYRTVPLDIAPRSAGVFDHSKK